MKNALLVPESAVSADRHGTFVWRIDDEVATRVPIQTGLRKQGRAHRIRHSTAARIAHGRDVVNVHTKT